MDRAGHILIALLVTALVWLPSWRLKLYSHSAGRPPLVALTARVALSDVLLFTWAYVWFGLFDLRIILFFIVMQEGAVILTNLLWRVYTPQGVEWRWAYLRMYGELRYSRRWLFILLNTVLVVSSVGATIGVYVGFIAIFHHPSYPSLFAVLAVSWGLGLVGISLACTWLLIQPALEDEARARLLLDLCYGWIIVFVATAMAGVGTVARVREIGLLPRPYHLQFPLSPLIVACFVLALLSLPMFLGGNRRTGEIQKVGRFERDMLNRLAIVNSAAENDKASSFIDFLTRLRARQQGFQRQTPPPGTLIAAFLKKMTEDTTPDAKSSGSTDPEDAEQDLDDHLSAIIAHAGADAKSSGSTDPEDAEQDLDDHLGAIIAHADKWVTISDWRDRVREFRELADAVEELRAEVAEEINEECDNESRLIRFLSRFMGYFLVVAVKQCAVMARGWEAYLDGLRYGDFRWRHLGWLETVIAHAEKVELSLGQISDRKRKEKYLSRTVFHFSEERDVASWSADDTSDKKRFGALMVLPFVVPVIMAVATPLIQHGLGLTH